MRLTAHLLKLLVEGRFPRIWMPSSEVRDLRQLLLHRYKLVIIRARVKNELQHLCLNKGVQRKRKLWSAARARSAVQLHSTACASAALLYSGKGVAVRSSPAPG